MFSSRSYWESRYARGGNSGAGSYNKFAEFKSEFINDLVRDFNIYSVLELGVGDGNQLSLFNIPSYCGVDVSDTIITACQKKFGNDKTKIFIPLESFNHNNVSFDLAISLDVIYHLIEEDIYIDYLNNLFLSSKRYVCIYSSNSESLNSEGTAPHVRHRNFSEFVKSKYPDWKLILFKKNIYPYSGDSKNSSFADFYVYKYIVK